MPKDETPAGIGHNSIDVDYNDLSGVLVDLANLKKQVSEANGDLRQAIKAYLDKYGWNKKALAVIRDIAAMSQTARKDFLLTFDAMYAAMKAEEWDGEVADLFAKQVEDAD